MSNLSSVPVLTAQQQGLGVYNTGTPASTSSNQTTAQNLAGQLDSTLPNGGVNANAALQIPTTPNPNSATTSSATFPGVVSNLANTSSAGSAQGQAATQQLAQTSAASSPAATAAQQATAQAGMLNPALAQNAANVATQYGNMGSTALNAAAPQLAGLATMGGGPIGLGQAGAIQNTVANYLQGLNSAEQLQLNPNAQELTAANQQASAETAAGNLANTQQSNIQSGLAAAGGLANTAQSNIQSGEQSAAALMQPSATFPFVFNPTTGQFTTSGGNLQTAISGGVQQAVANPGLYTSLNNAISQTYGSAAAGMFQQAYIAAGGNPNTATAAAGAAATNVGTTGTAATSAANAQYQSATDAVNKTTQSYSAASGVASNVESTLGTWIQNGLITNVNAGLNTLAGLTSNPQYAQFQTAITNAQAQYSAAFSNAGVTPTQTTANALAELNPNSSATAIIASLNQLSSDLYQATVLPAYQQQSTYAQQLGIQ